MSISPEIVEELSAWLDNYWKTYLKGDFDTWSAFIADDYYNIGGTKEEIWHSKQEILDYSYAIKDQMLGVVDIRNRKVEVNEYNDCYMVNEFTDVFIKADGEWILYGPFRMSSLLRKTGTGWIALHQHGSYPDMKALEGEAFSMDALRAENLKLQHAVDERTRDLAIKNRELEIEAALEKIRSASLAMQKSDELKVVIKIVYQQLIQLNIKLDHAGFVVDYTPYGDWHFWIADEHDIPSKITHPYFESVWATQFNEAKENGEAYFVTHLDFEEKNKFYQELLSYVPGLPAATRDFYFSCPGLAATTVLFKDVSLYIENFSGIAYSEEENNLLIRIGKVFQQAYTRFLDLQKAEAQAREAHIEAALEKVRSRSLAMHTANDLGEVVSVIVEKLTELGVVLDANGVILCTYFPDSKDVMHWIVSPDFKMAGSYLLPYFDHPIFSAAWESKESGEAYFSKAFSVAEKNSFFEYAFEYSDYRNFPEEFKQWVFQNDQHILSFAWQKNSAILIPSHTGVVPTIADVAILKRFASVFEQAYVRFMDLQKAEAQAREAQIESALERVRSRTMAMHRSEELSEVASMLFQQIGDLGIKVWTAGFNVWLNDDSAYQDWITSPKGGFIEPYVVDATQFPVFIEVREAKQRGDTFFVQYVGGEMIEAMYRELSKFAPKQFEIMLQDGFEFPKQQYDHFVFGSSVSLMFITFEPLPEAHDIFKRFGKVFEQTYTRFLDLQKAESQARNAQIDLAVERVRAKALAMHRSEEIMGLVAKLKDEVMSLEIPNVVAATIFLNEGDDKVRMWDLSTLEKLDEGYQVPLDITFTLKDYDPHLYIKRLWENPDNYFVEMQDEKGLQRIIGWLREYGKNTVADEVESYLHTAQIKQLYHAARKLENGKLVIDLLEPPAGEVESILTKMGAAFDLAYKRFLDLKKAEAQTREAQVELSLERIRSKVTSMQESGDLLDIMVSIRSEFVSLGHEAHYFWYMRWLPDMYEKAMTSGDGTQVGMIMTLPRSIHGDIPLVADWERGTEPTLIFPMETETAVDYVDKMIHQGDFELVDPNAPTLDDIRHIRGLTFVMARTSLGEIGYSLPGYVPDPPEEAVATLARFAGVFDLAYLRFEDLKKAEKDLLEIKFARAKAEAALAELKSAQAQLIQSEKMASLGELTAGIAHEIQNPLNFVNNFSEINDELISELLDELNSGNTDEAKTLAADIKNNAQKISEHGKRAGSIVKGMLEHSRKSEGKKELTDLNQLADECLRLAFHGYRAKDKSFHAAYLTHFADNMPHIPLVSQDIGRVLLNLINNAFYAVHEKASKLGEGYEPTVTLATSIRDNHVCLSVSDNGSGVPEEVKEKIFQPFFTTKPTGSGTGLGLSLSYDIIKAHGGEFLVTGNTGEGATFSILLPIT